MLAYTYIEQGKFALIEKPKPTLIEPTDAIVRVTLGGVDGCDCEEILRLIEERKIDTIPLITHRYSLDKIEEAYRIFENKEDGVIKVAIYNE